MFLRSVLLCGLHALALAGLLTEPSADSKVKLEQGSCPAYWFDSGTDCYKYVLSPLTWAHAEIYCQSLGAHLVSIHSSNEMKFITALIEIFDPTKGGHWIGFSDVHEEGYWMWSDGSPRDFARWYPDQPDDADGAEHCADIAFWKPLEPAWNDAPCTLVNPYVCKLRKTCP
ncbi:echinoidin-like [Gadus chalcogrammus]|uniref:echinoidin-like n=1 Tax=Gadus chalcogrammus TaxID=1042646 RepID=UPI0024C4E4C1|nr:echinoidin-like [Gadus chalcogrammus]